MRTAPSHAATFGTPDAVASHLAFDLTDTATANETFARWLETRDPRAERDIDLWTYCFVRRFLMLKFMRQDRTDVADFDMLLDKIYGKVLRHRTSIDRPSRYASWVSVVCKYAFIDYVRARRHHTPLDDCAPVAVEPVAEESCDRGFVRDAMLQAIDRLPAFLKEVATLYFAQNRPYEEIGEITGRPVPTIRAYVHKAVTRFRNDRALLSVVGG